jgi:hypothetical protein
MSRSIDQEQSITTQGAWNDPGASEQVSAITVMLSTHADRDYVEAWLKEHGLTVIPMQQGFNILGQNKLLRSLFSQEGSADPVPPPDLQPHIKAILVAERKYIHAS